SPSARPRGATPGARADAAAADGASRRPSGDCAAPTSHRESRTPEAPSRRTAARERPDHRAQSGGRRRSVSGVCNVVGASRSPAELRPGRRKTGCTPTGHRIFLQVRLNGGGERPSTESQADHMTYAIQADGLEKRLGETRALAGVSLTAPPGTVLGVLGPNGAGKPTMTRILATLIEPTAGSARVGGYDVVKEAHKVRQIGRAHV